MHDFKQCMPNCTVKGVDVSQYALDHALESVKADCSLASAEYLPFPDNSFDLVVSINSIHNLPLERLKTALREMMRVSRQHCYVTVDAWRNEQERVNLSKWVLTAETTMHAEDWVKLFKEVGYTGDYWWFIAH